LIPLHTLLAKPGRIQLYGAPEGHDAHVLSDLVAGGFSNSLIHICRDDGHMARFRAAIGFFNPDIQVLSFPAWDCLPYDRVSPNAEIVSRRIDTLTRLAADSEGAKRRIVLTTVNAITQRVVPRKLLRDRSLALKLGLKVPTDRLLSFLQSNGYVRTETVRESGEFAVRGGIVDLFPAGAAEALRIDFFGDEIDALRRFDPMTQRSTAKLDAVVLKPVSEVLLDQPAITRFRGRYRDLFGTVAPDDVLYGAVSEGRRHVGMEHWLPLYYESLETLFDYLPKAIISVDHRAEEVRATRLESIAEFYAARQSLTAARNIDAAMLYKPVAPDLLFLGEPEWQRILNTRSVAQVTPFPPPPEASANSYDAGAHRVLNFAEARANPKVNVFEVVRDRIATLKAANRKVAVAAFTKGAADRLRHVLTERGIEGVEPAETWAALQELSPRRVALVVLPLEHGFEVGKLTLISEQDILGDRLTRPPRRRRSNVDKFIAEVSALSVGDLVVHADHGIGRYEGLETLDVGGAAHDCLKVVYQGDDKLFVPVENIEVLSRYGSEDADAQLDKLGGVAWQSRKARVKQRIKDIADQLIKVAAERELREGEQIVTPAGLYDEFAARFPYPETEDQLNAITETLSDMASGRPMDRLICGDVGFGKTEVALRAAFVAAMAGHQVAVIVPTTLLCRQHFKTLTTRLQGLPIKVAQLSRLVNAKDSAEVKKGLADGTIDIVVGTHAILAKGIEFRQLGLLIVDEEQHFGVAQKERLKRLKANVHVLTLTATPIPRTLQMALSGVREMSLIATPPVDRLAVRTFVMPYDPVVVREAILRERNRGGQSFYIVPRIKDLDEVKEELTRLVPEVKVAMAHGRMAPTELEDVMTAFDDGKYDMLLATNIVESGLDIPSANTMILHRSDMFGLAQLYQLRGRVGRGKVRAYAYLTLPPSKALTETAMKRLEVMQTLDTLGAGFQLASHDLDIRGAGNLLGDEQSGHIREVGIELYQHLLEEAVADARASAAGEAKAAEDWTPTITLGTAVLIPETYVADLGVRLGLYRRLATLIDRAEIDGFAAELIDRFGPLPAEVENLLQIMAIKRLCKEAGIEKVDAGPKGAVITFRANSFANPARLIDLIQKSAGVMKVRPDQKLVLLRDLEDQTERMAQVTRLLTKLAELAKAPATEIRVPPANPVLVKKPPNQPATSRAKPAGVRR
jgi:transcription-repair coupling factor (superfamily II helicase)